MKTRSITGLAGNRAYFGDGVGVGVLVDPGETDRAGVETGEANEPEAGVGCGLIKRGCTRAAWDVRFGSPILSGSRSSSFIAGGGVPIMIKEGVGRRRGLLCNVGSTVSDWSAEV